MGGRSTYLHFVESQSWRLCLHHLRHQSFQAETKFQQLVLEPFSNRLYMHNLKEKLFWKGFEAKE